MRLSSGKPKRKTSAAIFFALSARKLLNWMPDQLYLSTLWLAYFHKKLDWKNPTSFNEKIQWLKVKNRNPLYPTLVDKYAVRQCLNSSFTFSPMKIFKNGMTTCCQSKILVKAL